MLMVTKVSWATKQIINPKLELQVTIDASDPHHQRFQTRVMWFHYASKTPHFWNHVCLPALRHAMRLSFRFCFRFDLRFWFAGE
ncbi:hypothetical protein AXX17_AT5G61790 [Arabidopsis thaliana]|jgi:hypothetical protein|uniref:Uncharacterized protein n=1 Tax=Arabidopsis thaliana TaxID=3702 RepID=A0A178UNH4_ARATH|nr:hypothetical protein AXX17_AT5G61790 [Arabidopsis thaliana]